MYGVLMAGANFVLSTTGYLESALCQSYAKAMLDGEQMRELGIHHPRSGELLAIAEPGCWFAYHYWLDEARAPDFARCVAIHAKPGWDPVELFWAPGLRGRMHLAKRLVQKALGIRAPFDLISTDTSMVHGSHGRIPTDEQQRPVLAAGNGKTVGNLLEQFDRIVEIIGAGQFHGFVLVGEQQVDLVADHRFERIAKETHHVRIGQG